MRQMPTAGKLTGAVGLAAVSFLAASRIVLHIPDDRPMTNFIIASVVLGLIIGWFVLGRRVGRGAGTWNGIYSAATILIVGVFGFAGSVMLKRSTKFRYDDPFEAVMAVFDIMYDLTLKHLSLDVIAIVFVGGAIVGALVEWAHRRWT